MMGQDVLEAVPCDLCSAEDAIELYPSTFADTEAPASAWYSSSRRRAVRGRIVRCTQCGLVRTSPRDTPQTLAAVYTALQDPLYDAESVNRNVTARRHLALVERYARPPGHLLDVGCSTGIFMAAARAHGWDVAGIDASAWAVARARERFGLRSIRQSMVEQAIIPPDSCDVIVLWDLLEHVASPTAVLRRLHRWLKTGGYLFLNVPNVESTLAKLLGSRWPLLLREHLWYFSPTTMDALLSTTGFTLLRNEPNYVTFSLSNVLIRFSQYGGPGYSLCRRLAGQPLARRVCLRFPPGEVNVVARRQ